MQRKDRVQGAPSGRVRRAPHSAAGGGEPGSNLGHEVLNAWMTPEMRRRGPWARLGVNMRRAASCAWALGGMMWAVVGCSARPGEGRSLGADLGTFSVDAERE